MVIPGRLVLVGARASALPVARDGVALRAHTQVATLTSPTPALRHASEDGAYGP